MYTALLEVLQEHYQHVEWREFACGCGAAFVNITLTYPIYKIIFRQMLSGITMKSAFLQLHHEGLYFLYRGMAPPLAQKCLSSSIMFGMYENVRRPLEQTMNIYVAKSVAAVVSGTVEVSLMPFERVQTLLASSAYHLRFRNMYHAFHVIATTYGFKEYYRGMTPIIWRNCSSNIMFFVSRDEVQRRLKNEKDSVLRKTLNDFICGAVIGAVTSSIIYPLNVVKVSIQSQLGGNAPKMLVAFKQIYIERGSKLRHIYHGVEVNLIRAFLSWGVMNAAYDNLKRIFIDEK